jgi:outer membrane biosynthesis protein TonB
VNLLVALVVIAVAAATFVFSYDGVHAIALLGGMSTQLARYYPGLFDAVLVIACVAAVVLRDGRWWARAWAWVVLVVVLAAIGATDVVHAMNYTLRPRTTEGIVAAAPVVAVLLAFSLLLTLLRQSRSHGAGGAADNGPGDPATRRPAMPVPFDLPALPAAPSGADAATMANMANMAAMASMTTAADAATVETQAMTAAPPTRAPIALPAGPEPGPHTPPDGLPAMPRPATEPNETLPPAPPPVASQRAPEGDPAPPTVSSPAVSPARTPSEPAEPAEPAQPEQPEEPEQSEEPAPARPPGGGIRYAGSGAQGRAADEAVAADYWEDGGAEGSGPAHRTEPQEIDEDAPPFATAPFAAVPRLNRVRSMPVPPEDDDEPE